MGRIVVFGLVARRIVVGRLAAVIGPAVFGLGKVVTLTVSTAVGPAVVSTGLIVWLTDVLRPCVAEVCRPFVVVTFFSVVDKVFVVVDKVVVVVDDLNVVCLLAV